MRYIAIIILFILFIPLPAFCRNFSDGKITALEVEGAVSVKPDAIISMMGIEIGNPYSIEAIREGIKRTYLKGIFEDIAVDAEEFKGGVRLKYIVKEKVFIRSISLSGNQSISSRMLRERISVKEGDEYRKENLKNIETEIKALYGRRGYKSAEVKINIEEVDPYKVKLLVRIEEGTAIKIKKIEFKGEPTFESSKILNIVNIAEGDVFDEIILDRGLKDLRAFYINNGYLTPQIGPAETEYIGDEVSIKIPIKPGLLVKINFEGNTVFSSEKLFKEIPLIEEEAFSDELIQDSAERIVELYRKEGYYFSRTSVNTRWSGDRKEVDISFYIFEGEKLRIKEINFEGNNAVTSAKLKAIMTLKETGFFTAGYFDDRVLDRDLEDMENLYRGLGYLSAKAKGEITFNDSETEGYIKIAINEGVQSKVEEVTIEGSTVFSKEDILKAIYLKKGMPYNDVDLGEDRYRILSLYLRKGYIYAEVEAKRSLSPDSSQVFISFRIFEDRPVTVGKVIIRGNQDTNDQVIRRELLVRDDDVYDQELVLKTVQRIYRLGLFSQVRFEPIDPYRKTDRKDMLLTVKERDAGAVDLGVGYGDYDKLRGFIEISHKNLWGHNRQISLRAEAGNILRRYALGFKEPWFLNHRIDFRASIIHEYKKILEINPNSFFNRSVDTKYETKRTAGLAGVEKEITDMIRGTIFYEYERIDTFNVRPGAIITKDDSGTLGISSIIPSITLDTRDDPFNPGSGILSGITLKLATKYFGSEIEFYKFIFQGGWYKKLWGKNVLALSARGGLARAFGNTEEIPIIERFFLGGRNTVRGYAQDTLGPRGPDGTPTGGNTFLLLNGEIRFNLGRDFGIVTFADAGNTWLSADPERIRHLKYTAGLGLRYITPVGPLRLDYGYKIKREPGESAGELHFVIGHAF